MSTKTTFKRVALVAVAALGLGVLSVAPSNAFTQADSLTVSSATAAVLSTDTATATSAPTATLAFLASAGTDSMTITASLVSAPATGTALPYLQLSESTSAIVKDSTNAALAVGSAQAANGKVYVNTTGGSTATRVSATFKVYLGTSATAGATVAGTYVVKLTPEVVAGSGTVNAVAQTITFTVTALDTNADSTSTSVIARGAVVPGDIDSTTTFSKALNASGVGIQAATIKLTQKSANALAVPNESVTAIITGPGSLTTGSAASNSTPSGARAVSAKNGDYIRVYSDGSSGVATITMTGATSGKVLATEKVTFFGDAKTVTAEVVKSVIGTGDVAGTLLVKVKDDSGVDVTGLSAIGVVSSATSKIATVYNAAATFDDTKGGYLVTVNGVAAGSAALTATTKASAAATTGVDAAAAVTVRVGSITPASVSVTTDKTSYAPGEKATITVVLKDADGLTLADHATAYTNIWATGGIVSSYTLGAGSDSITGTSVLDFASQKKDYTVYMPVTEGDVTFKWTTGTGLATANQGKEGSLTVAVSSTGTAAALDAANEATDAANAATDAALAAADAADAATAAAEDASAAVAALAKSVNTALNNLKKQITALTKLVNKLLK
jgi:hypothetical protein